MGDNTEQRTCLRFEIPGAKLHYWKAEFDPVGKTDGEQGCLVLDLSRRGLRFLSQEEIPIQSLIQLDIDLPEESQILSMRGQIIWSVLDPTETYTFQNGVLFDTEWMAGDEGARESRQLLEALEAKYCNLE